MDNIFDIFQTTLLSTHPDYFSVLRRVMALQRDLDGCSLARSRPIRRLLLAWRDDESMGYADTLVLLRQIIRNFDALRTPQEFWHPLRRYALDFSLQAFDNSDNTVTVMALPWECDWLEHTSNIDALKLRRTIEPLPTEGPMYQMGVGSGRDLTRYSSEGQRRAVYGSLLASPGTTTLITLPTGAGKSMCILLPAWIKSRGGQYPGGTTLVVVPTISLAYDQESNAQAFFPNTPMPEYLPTAVTGHTNVKQRQTVRQGITNGTIPIVYLSPETLLNSEFYTLCIKAARNGKINRVVIDEAHLVETWGAKFRAEFQLLSTYCRHLLDAANGRVDFLLLSATVSQSALRTLRQLFEFDGGFQHISANQLRPEIGFWFSRGVDEDEKKDHLVQSLRHLPRPAILYVTQPKHAKAWVSELKRKGFKRLAAFSGNTPDNERQRILDQWARDEIDLIVATSAFGLGVDKPDIRAVIHGSLPESVDRFYQEIGRGGRDGCSSISLTCITEEDEHLARDMHRSAVITTAKAWDRWHTMFQNADHIEQSTTWIVNTTNTPFTRPDTDESEVNTDWNEHTLLLMQRAELIHIADMHPTPLDKEGEKGWQLHIETLDDAVSAKDQYLEKLEPKRKEERTAITKAVAAARSLVRTYQAPTSRTRCIAYELEKVYQPVALTCGGCPACRKSDIEPYADMPLIDFSDEDKSIQPGKISSDLDSYIGSGGVLQILWEDRPDNNELPNQFDLVGILVKQGIQQIIVPDRLYTDTRDILTLQNTLKESPYLTQILLSQSDLETLAPYVLPTVVLYPIAPRIADRLHRSISIWKRNTSHIPLIYIVHHQLELPSLNGRFRDRIRGHQVTATTFRQWWQRVSTTL